MATKLTQAQMDALRAPSSGSGWGGLGYTTDPETGQVLQSIDGGGYARYTPRADGKYSTYGDKYSRFGADGEYEKDYSHMESDSMKEVMMMAALAMGGIGALGSAAGVPLGFGGGAAAGGGIDMGAAGLGDLAGQAGAADGFGGLGFGGGQGLSGYAGGADVMGLGAGSTYGAGMGSAGLPQLSASLAGGAAAGGGGAAGGAAGGAGGAGTAGAAGAAGSGLSGVSSLLGPGATLLGAIAGGQDQPGQTSTRDLPEWLKPYVTGMLDKTRGLLDQQMPIAQQQATGLLDKGNSLMSINPAGNGFGLFTKGRY